MLIEALKPLCVKLRTREVRLQPGRPVRFSDEGGRKLLEQAPDKVRRVTPDPPIQPGWIVTYRDGRGTLRGGCIDREQGTVKECLWEEGTGWTLHLTDGHRLPLTLIQAVGKTDAEGHVLAAWEVRRHGYDGRKQEEKP